MKLLRCCTVPGFLTFDILGTESSYAIDCSSSQSC